MVSQPAQPSMATTISVDEDLADELYARKGRGESYADVIRRLIEQAENAAEPAESDAEGATPGAGTDSVTPAHTRDESAAESGAESLNDIIDAVAEDFLPGSGWKLDERREALHAVVDYLREHGTAKPADFERDVYPNHSAGYTDGKDPARSWWKNAMYEGLSEVADRSDAVHSADQSGEWAYRE